MTNIPSRHMPLTNIRLWPRAIPDKANSAKAELSTKIQTWFGHLKIFVRPHVPFETIPSELRNSDARFYHHFPFSLRSLFYINKLMRSYFLNFTRPKQANRARYNKPPRALPGAEVFGNTEQEGLEEVFAGLFQQGACDWLLIGIAGKQVPSEGWGVMQ